MLKQLIAQFSKQVLAIIVSVRHVFNTNQICQLVKLSFIFQSSTANNYLIQSVKWKNEKPPQTVNRRQL